MTTFTEAFTGAAGALGAPWVNAAGYTPLQRDGAGKGGVGGDTAGLVPPPAGLDLSATYDVSAVMSNLTNQRGVWGRTTIDGNTLWQAWVNIDGSYEFWKRIAGSWSQISPTLAAGTVVVGDRVGLHVDNVAQTVQRTLNGALVGAAASTAGAATDNYNGLLVYANSRVDDFIIDDLVVSEIDAGGTIDLPAPALTGTLQRAAHITGTLAFPTPALTGGLQSVGHVSGAILVPAPTLSGQLGTSLEADIVGTIAFPTLVLTGQLKQIAHVGGVIDVPPINVHVTVHFVYMGEPVILPDGPLFLSWTSQAEQLGVFFTALNQLSLAQEGLDVALNTFKFKRGELVPWQLQVVNGAGVAVDVSDLVTAYITVGKKGKPPLIDHEPLDIEPPNTLVYSPTTIQVAESGRWLVEIDANFVDGQRRLLPSPEGEGMLIIGDAITTP
jgi:hypothetical protein